MTRFLVRRWTGTCSPQSSAAGPLGVGVQWPGGRSSALDSYAGAAAQVCGFVEPTRALCWQVAREAREFVKVGEWIT